VECRFITKKTADIRVNVRIHGKNDFAEERI